MDAPTSNAGHHVRLTRRALRASAMVALVLFAAAGCGSDAHTATSGDGLVAIGAGLRGRPGLTASVYATGLPNVAAVAFDPSGRAWVATAAFTDTGADAVYVVTRAGATPVKVIGGLHTPLGLLWAAGSLVVSSKERVDAYGGFTGSAFAPRRTLLTLPKGVGESNGLTRSPGGRYVLGISAPCNACTPASKLSGAVVSFRADGSDLRVEAGAIRAPVGLAYVPGTSDLYVSMNQRDDLGAATPGDWLALVRRGQSWGAPACYGQAGAACAHAPRPVAVLDKHAAVSGVAIVTGGRTTGAGPTALVAEWTLGKVQQVALRGSGTTPLGQVRPFIAGLQRPVPVVSGPGGTIVVGDWQTGTLYLVSGV
jgi:glucose/arabinose dehydrogenase